MTVDPSATEPSATPTRQVPPETPLDDDADMSEQAYARQAGANAEPVEQPLDDQPSGGQIR